MSVPTCMSVGATFTTFCHHSVLRRSCWRFGGFSFPSMIANPGICSVTYESLAMISVSALTCMMINISKMLENITRSPPHIWSILASVCQLCNGWNFQSIYRLSRNSTGVSTIIVFRGYFLKCVKCNKGLPVFFWSFWQLLVSKEIETDTKASTAN